MTLNSKISPFDIAAETYDEDFTKSQIGQLQRERVWQLLTSLLRSYARPLNILEINCGTGEDAIRLAQLGHHVVATDASEQMIQRAKQKLQGASFNTRQPEFITCSYAQLPDHNFQTSFDLVISNFGGLNCVDEKEITDLRDNLYQLLTTGGKLLLVVLSKCCLWEMTYHSFKRNFKTAFRRWKRSVPFQVNGHTMDIFYYSPLTLTKLFQPAFSRLLLQPVGLFIPPSYLKSIFLKRRGLLQFLNRLETKLNFSSLSFLADHYCVILNKKQTLK